MRPPAGLLLLGLTVTGAGLSACSGSGSPAPSPSPPAAPPAPSVAATPAGTGTGVLRGHLYAAGGPVPGQQTAVAGSVTVTGPAGQREVPVTEDGGYTVTLAAGSYTVTGQSPQVIVYGKPAVCTVAAPVTVTAGATVTADPVCSLP